jgi:sugar (pentulose or hexulose) kinase
MSRDVIAGGRAVLGIELGSTRIKACLVDDGGAVLATGSHQWESSLVDGVWSYSLDEVWAGLQDCYASLAAQTQRLFGVRPSTYRAIGVSAMMHGYLAFGADDELLVPLRTWRNTSTGPAAAQLTQALGQNIPMRWSVAHLFQAVLDGEPHLADLARLTTLAGYVHERLTGRRVLGVGDASGMFPVDPVTCTYDAAMLSATDRLLASRGDLPPLVALLPEVLPAGRPAGTLTAEGARLLDPGGTLRPGAPLCPPEGDAGTGMVATNAVNPRTANVSVGTSIFAMVVLDAPLPGAEEAIDVVTTPAGLPVAMVHCNNGAHEIGVWTGLFTDFAAALGLDVESDRIYAALLRTALDGEPDAGGVLSYNYLAGEPVTGLAAGRPLVVRTPDARFTLANVMRSQLYASFATLALGMRLLRTRGVKVAVMHAHGGLFRTEGVAQRLLAASIDTPVSVAQTSGEGGAWGIALLAGYLRHAAVTDLGTYLDEQVFGVSSGSLVAPDPLDVAGFAGFLARFEAGLAVERAAVLAL